MARASFEDILGAAQANAETQEYEISTGEDGEAVTVLMRALTLVESRRAVVRSGGDPSLLAKYMILYGLVEPALTEGQVDKMLETMVAGQVFALYLAIDRLSQGSASEVASLAEAFRNASTESAD